jgi:hypothetical protein
MFCNCTNNEAIQIIEMDRRMLSNVATPVSDRVRAVIEHDGLKTKLLQFLEKLACTESDYLIAFHGLNAREIKDEMHVLHFGGGIGSATSSTSCVISPSRTMDMQLLRILGGIVFDLLFPDGKYF